MMRIYAEAFMIATRQPQPLVEVPAPHRPRPFWRRLRRVALREI